MKRFDITHSNILDLETAIIIYEKYGSATVCQDGKPYGYYDEKKVKK